MYLSTRVMKFIWVLGTHLKSANVLLHEYIRRQLRGGQRKVCSLLPIG